MRTAIPLPPAELLQEYFAYSPITGELRWRKHLTRSDGQKSRKSTPGKVAGHTHSRGYVYTSFAGQVYRNHRLIWRLVTGTDPGDLVVHHRDDDGTNNAWHNLSLCTQGENLMFQKRNRG